MEDLRGRTAFVTGGANGIGLALARALLAEGCRVAIADIRQDALDQALASLDNREVIGLQLDVNSRVGFAQAADRVEEEVGPISLLFNNAGVNLFQPIDECSYDDWDWLLGVNLHGVINGIVTFVPRMKRRAIGGHVVNTASMASFLASGIPGAYNATKYAVRGISESLRSSLRPHGIGVSVLCPGLVRSAIFRSDEVRPARFRSDARSVDPDFVAQLGRVHDAGMDPEEVAAKTIAGIRENRCYIFPHPEFHGELAEIFDEILGEFEAEPVPQARAAFESDRCERYRAARLPLRDK